MNILQDVSQDVQAELAKLRAENQALRDKAAKAAQRRLSLKVSEKGAVSIYGMGRFPITLYKGQWEKLIAYIGEVQSFIEDNAHLLKEKE